MAKKKTQTRKPAKAASARKAVKKPASKSAKRSARGKTTARKTLKKTASKPTTRAARGKTTTRKAAKPTVRKAAPTKAIRGVRKAAKKPAPKPTRPAAKPTSVAAKPFTSAPVPQVAQPVVPMPPAAPMPPPREVTPPRRPETASGPTLFEPDDLPTAARAAGTGPFYENDRRDRPFYDTETEESGEEDLDEEDDDEITSPARGGAAPRAGTAGPLQVGDAAPDFVLRDQEGNEHSLATYRGRKVVLYFYPKDDTPGCTREACGFRDTLGGFTTRNAVVLGVSPDSAASHARFAAKYGLTFPLLVDADHEVARRYGAWGEKTMPDGRRTTGILRTTYVIDEAGRIAEVFRGVTPDGHADEVLERLRR